MHKIACPECSHEFEMEVWPAAPVPRPRRWLRAALLLAGLAAVGACAWWVLLK